jgi:hypothetical protein
VVANKAILVLAPIQGLSIQNLEQPPLGPGLERLIRHVDRRDRAVEATGGRIERVDWQRAIERVAARAHIRPDRRGSEKGRVDHEELAFGSGTTPRHRAGPRAGRSDAAFSVTQMLGLTASADSFLPANIGSTFAHNSRLQYRLDIPAKLVGLHERPSRAVIQRTLRALAHLILDGSFSRLTSVA